MCRKCGIRVNLSQEDFIGEEVGFLSGGPCRLMRESYHPWMKVIVTVPDF